MSEIKDTAIQVPNLGDYVMFMRTVQSNPIRTLSEALKEILIDVNIHFDKTGVRIMTMDQKKVAFVHLKLDAEKFDNYYCPEQITIGVNMISLHKLLKTINNSDIITFYVTKTDDHKLGIKIENKEKKITSSTKLKLIDLDNDAIRIPVITFESVFSVPCTDFQKHCRDLFSISENVDIYTKYNDKAFTMEAIGGWAEQEIEIGGRDVADTADDKKKFIGTYSLEYLNLCCKASGLCPSVEIFLKENEFPILLSYSVAAIGMLKIGLAPKVRTD
jgi:proliferating cell nuclear antigen PCNA